MLSKEENMINELPQQITDKKLAESAGIFLTQNSWISTKYIGSGRKKFTFFNINLEGDVKVTFRLKCKIIESVSNFLDEIWNTIGANNKVLMRTLIKIKWKYTGSFLLQPKIAVWTINYYERIQ